MRGKQTTHFLDLNLKGARNRDEDREMDAKKQTKECLRKYVAVEWKRGRRRRSQKKENLEEMPQRQDPDSSCFHTRIGTDCPAMCPAEIIERETKRTTNTSLKPQMEILQAGAQGCPSRRMFDRIRLCSSINFSPTLSATFCLFPQLPH